MANFNIDYLVVAGGGAGGGYYRGGGGGAGELKESASSIALSTGSSYDVVVGAGGAGVIVSSDSGSNGNNGDNSTFYNITSLGGGGGSPGDSSSGNAGSDGGSGGGAGGNWGGTSANGGSANGTGLGNNGGAGAVVQCGGGGGGATQAGFNAGTSGTAGDGGAGKTYTAATSITGQPFAVAGGGGGANYGGGNITIGGVGGGAAGASGSSPYISGPSGANNTGGGGGGGNGISPQGAGGDGGSGIVILRYTTADVAGYTTTGITPTEDTTTISGQTILSFTTVGTGTITFTAPAIPITPFDGTKVTAPVTGFDKTNTTQGLKLPSGTNSNQPVGAFAEQGMIRNDTEETVDSSASAMTHYNGTNWQYFAATESADPSPSLIANTNLLLEAFNSSSYSGSGATWTDLSTEQDNATLYNISSNNNQYFDFNGSSQWAEGDSAITGQEYSVCMWINPDVNTTGSPFETGDASGTGVYNNRLFFSSTTFYASMNGGGDGFAQVAASNFPVNTWTFLCVTYSNTSVTIYKNNAVSLATASTSGSFGSTAKYRIGVNKNNGTNRQYFDGQISKVQTIQGVISTAQIQFLYGLGKGF